MKGGASATALAQESTAATAALANMMEFFRYWGTSKLVRRHESPELAWIDSNLEFSFFNHVYLTKLKPESADSAIEETLSNFEDRALTFEWPILPGTEPEDLPARLKEHGFVLEARRPAMICDLTKLRHDLPSPPGFSVRKVESDEDLQIFMYATQRAFEVSNRDSSVFLDILRGLGVGSRSRYEGYIGIHESKPVATSMLFCAEGVAGVYWVGTAPEARGKGVGTQMTLKPLIDAHETGFDLATLQATAMGEPVYRRIGFEDCFRFEDFVHKHVPR